MRPISLEMEGFTSFRQKAVIDFTAFDLFAITGPTGAGKTSIIDALTYALYGCTPRLGKQSVSELISQGADHAKVMLEFSSGKSRYRVARQTKWTGKKAISDVRLDQIDGDKSVPLADKITQAEALIEAIVGLDFNGFTKSVVLPQGRFDEFLKGKVDERRKILSDLLQLDIYGRMLQRANEIAKENRSKSETLAGLLARDYADSTPERLTRLREELEALRPSLEPLALQLGRIRESTPVAHQLRQAGNDLAAAEAELKKVGPDRASAEKRLADAKQTIQNKQARIDEIDARMKTSVFDSKVRDDLVAKQHKAELLQDREGRERTLQETLKTKSHRLGELEAEYKKAESARATAREKRDSLQKRLDADKKALEAAVKKHGSPDAIKAVIEVNRRRLKEELKRAKLEKELARLTEDEKGREKRLAEIGEEITEAGNRLGRSKAELETLIRKHSAEELRLALEEGKPCPVCEQPVKRVPKATAHPSVELAKKSVGKHEEDLNRLVKSKSTMEGELTQLAPRLEAKRSEIKETETSVSEAAAQIRSVLKKTPGPDAEAELETLREQTVVLQANVDQGVAGVNRLRETESTANERVQDIKRLVVGIETEVTGASRDLQPLQAEIKGLRKILGKYTDVSIVDAELKQQNDAKSELETNQRLKETEGEGLAKAKDALAEESRVLEGFKVKAETLERSRVELGDRIKRHTDAILTVFPDLGVDAGDLDQDPAAQLERRSQALQSDRDAIQKKILQREEEIKTLEVQIKRGAELRAEIERHRGEAAVAHELALALRGDQFIAFIQQEAYHRLALDGSRHLKTLSSDRYSFGFEKDEFVVLDHWNADEPRPVTTLSGGESFLASLALALALAEGLSGLSHGRGRFALESLFLDEGFGTLDVETLDVVLQGVENLSTTDRLVGIVSHIPELAERMPFRIDVRKAIGGSTIEVR